MFLKQIGDEILFGTNEQRYKFKLRRIAGEDRAQFDAQDVSDAANALSAAYPDETDAIDRYAIRLMEMVE